MFPWPYAVLARNNLYAALQLQRSCSVATARCRSPPGLPNTGGNLCFLNALVQALASLPALQHVLRKRVTQPDDDVAGPLCIALLDALAYLNNELPAHCNATRINAAFRHLQSHFEILFGKTSGQTRHLGAVGLQDVHEALQSILESIAFAPSSVSSQIPCAPSLVGMLSHGTQCLSCGAITPTGTSAFLMLEVQARGSTPLTRLLETQICATTIVHDVECPSCLASDETCPKRSKALLCTVEKLPDILTIHLQRLTCLDDDGFGSYPQKDTTHVAFPLVLDLPQRIMSQGHSSVGTLYELRAVVEHLGNTATSGNFATYRRWDTLASPFSERERGLENHV